MKGGSQPGFCCTAASLQKPGHFLESSSSTAATKRRSWQMGQNMSNLESCTQTLGFEKRESEAMSAINNQPKSRDL
jgi:hypothetical protein